MRAAEFRGLCRMPSRRCECRNERLRPRLPALPARMSRNEKGGSGGAAEEVPASGPLVALPAPGTTP
jgi:hypothetical protein